MPSAQQDRGFFSGGGNFSTERADRNHRPGGTDRLTGRPRGDSPAKVPVAVTHEDRCEVPLTGIPVATALDSPPDIERASRGEVMTDRELKKHVEDALGWEPSIDESKIG